MPDPRVDALREDVAALKDQIQAYSDREQSHFDLLRGGQANVQASMDEMNGRVGRLYAEIGPGIPDAEERGKRLTIRERLHTMETNGTMIDQLAETLMQQLASVTTVVHDLQSERDKSRIEREAQTQMRQEQAKRWTRAKVIFVTICTGVGACGAIIGATFTILRYAGHGG